MPCRVVFSYRYLPVGHYFSKQTLKKHGHMAVNIVDFPRNLFNLHLFRRL
ncbi:hypothetical protein C1G87_0392 [Dehalococcoides mccartyi]|uniref:Uncharacterized protein n=2 Tax=Dehalococcoides mccartyi TaxID=61435 RepID=A0A142VA30_9CHLR|nr:hypothetical protein dcmb_432 [Dehalococcoides mccartyi DCMB5]AGG07493.1 hypothetical protein btf_386 [Dehalococcoides mccartyi BTF08]AMU86187.1 hypothetical protein Dm11a5_0361 [Dehalococcoides mccartyi]CAI82585.1 hypothetical protein cbdbB13 [Dehalococcoides mccartyi CBDB1]AOV99026.1 hypothetical protein DCWBC2_0359 [Dehalococcoides mccartyi]